MGSAGARGEEGSHATPNQGSAGKDVGYSEILSPDFSGVLKVVSRPASRLLLPLALLALVVLVLILTGLINMPGTANAVIGGACLGLSLCLGIAWLCSLLRPKAFHARGFRLSGDSIEFGEFHLNAGHLEKLKGGHARVNVLKQGGVEEGVLRAPLWQVVSSHPLNRTTLLINLTRSKHAGQRNYVLGRIGMNVPGGSWREITSATVHDAYANTDFWIVHHGSVFSLLDDTGKYNQGLPPQMERLGEMLLKYQTEHGLRVAITASISPISLTMAFLTAGQVGMLIATAIDKSRQASIDHGLRVGYLVHEEFDAQIRPLIRRYGWVVRSSGEPPAA